jgi:hypothetical protein
MRGAIPPLSDTPSWRGAQLKQLTRYVTRISKLRQVRTKTPVWDFEVFTAVKIQVVAFCIVTPWRCVVGLCYLHLRCLGGCNTQHGVTTRKTTTWISDANIYSVQNLDAHKAAESPPASRKQKLWNVSQFLGFISTLEPFRGDAINES